MASSGTEMPGVAKPAHAFVRPPRSHCVRPVGRSSGARRTGRAIAAPGLVLPAFAALCLPLPTLAAAAERASFVVSASVRARAELTVIREPVSIELTRDDLHAGFKDVDARYAVASNDPRGYLLRIAPRVGYTQRIEVHGLDGPAVVLRDLPIEIARAGGVASPVLSLRFRLALTPGLAPGRYPLPVELAALPL